MAYLEEFYRFSSRCDLSITDEQQTVKYISILKYLIQERKILHDVLVGCLKITEDKTSNADLKPTRRSRFNPKCNTRRSPHIKHDTHTAPSNADLNQDHISTLNTGLGSSTCQHRCEHVRSAFTATVRSAFY